MGARSARAEESARALAPRHAPLRAVRPWPLVLLALVPTVAAEWACGALAEGDASAPGCQEDEDLYEGDETSLFQSNLVVLTQKSGQPSGVAVGEGAAADLPRSAYEEPEEGALLQMGVPRAATIATQDSPGALGGVIVRSGRLRTTGTAAAASRGSDGGAPKAGIDAAAAPSAEPATGPELGAVMAVAEASAALAAKANAALADEAAGTPPPERGGAAGVVPRVGSPDSLAWLRFGICFLAVAAIATGSYFRIRRKGGPSGVPSDVEAAGEGEPGPLRDEAGGVVEPDLEEAPAGPPLVSLSQVGASFSVPWARIQNCGACSLTVDVPVSPAVWPLRAFFVRNEGQHSWTRTELTVDIIDAAGLPPLLYCYQSGDARKMAPVVPRTPRPRCEGTGGTGDMEDDVDSDDEDANDGAAGQGDNDIWLQVRSGNGALTAEIAREWKGRCSIRRPGQTTPWEVEWLPEQSTQVLVAHKLDRPVAVATYDSDGGGRDERCLRIDTQADASCPESVLLMMCMTAMLTFPPATSKLA